MRCLTALVVVLLAFTVSAQTQLQLNITLPNQSVLPCLIAEYTVAITDASANNYLFVEVVSNSSNTYVELSNEEDYFFGQASVYLIAGPNSNPSVELVCNFTSITWYIAVWADDDTPISFNVTATEYPIAYTNLALGTPINNIPKTYNTSLYTNEYDLYHFQIEGTAPYPGQTLEITITDNSGGIAGMYLNKGAAPAIGCSIINAGTTWTIDYCTLAWLMSEPGSDFYLAVEPSGFSAIDYVIEVSSPYPAITGLQLNQTSPVHELTFAGQIQYYSISIANNTSEAQVLNISVSNVQNGEVTLEYAYGELPFVDCLGTGCPAGNTNGCCQSVSTTCQLVVQPCNIQNGTYYIGVQQVGTFSSPVFGVVYQLVVTLTNFGEPTDLFQGEFYSGAVSQAQYNHYLFDDSGFDVGDQTLVNFHLYVDISGQSDTDVQTFLYVNNDYYAGSGNSTGCWGNVASCSVTGTQGACTVQINSCEYNLYDEWYTSVYVSDQGTFYGSSVMYTIAAELVDPVELDTPFLVLHSSLAAKQYDHYTLDGDLLGEGERVALYVFDIVGGSLTIYKNNGDLAGADTGSCPQCYNSTESVTVSSPYAWILANCAQKREIDFGDLYFSVYSVSQQTTYSITLITDDGDDEDNVSDDLEQNEVLVVEVAPVTGLAYSVRSDPGEESYLQFTLTIVDYTGGSVPEVSLTLSNTTYFNCVPTDEDQKLSFEVQTYSCTVDATGFCTIVVQNCVFNTTDGWIAQVYNPATAGAVYVNLWYDIYQATPTELTSGQSVASSVAQDVYQQYSYTTKGTDTFIIEVFFDNCLDQNEDACQGTLYVSDFGPTGPTAQGTPCVSAFFTGTDSERVTYVASSCSLEAQTFYFAVGSSSPLNPSYPLRYTVTVTEKSYSVPTTLNVPMSMQIYPGEKIYHTFSVNLQASTGAFLYWFISNLQGSGNLYPVIAEQAAPANNSCCYEYSQDSEVEYCQATVTSGTWSVLVQASSTTDPYQPLGYTIFIGQAGSTPNTLALDTPTAGSVNAGFYTSYLVNTTVSTTDQLILTISNNNDGVLVPYYSSSNPPTEDCADGTLSPCGPGQVCSYQIQSCIGSPKYISLQGSNAVNYNPITYSLVLSQSPTVAITATPLTRSLPNGFIEVFTYTTNLTNLIAPQVTFSITGAVSTGGALQYLFTISSSLCDNVPDIINTLCTGATCTLEISDCDMGTGVYYVIVESQGGSFNYSIAATTVDLVAGAQSIAPGSGGTTVVGTAGQFYPFKTLAPASEDFWSLSYQVSGLTGGNNGISFNFETATPDCTLSTSTTYTVSACCLKQGEYYLLVQPANDGNFTVQFTLDQVATFNTTQTTPNVVIEYELAPITATDYVSFYTELNSDAFFSFGYWQRVTAAGPSQGQDEYCLSSGWSCIGVPNCAVVQLQCFGFNATTISQPYIVGSVYGGYLSAQNGTTGTPTAGTLSDQPLTIGNQISYAANPLLPGYYYVTIPSAQVDAGNLVQFTLTSNSSILQGNVYYNNRCTTPVTQCTGNPCTMSVSTCGNYGELYLSIDLTAGSTAQNISVLAQYVPAWTITDALNPNATLGITNNTGPTYYTADITGASDSTAQYFELTVFGVSLTASVSVSWSIKGTPICLQPGDLICDSTGATQSCTLYVADCQITDGTYYFQVAVTQASNYSISWSGLKTQPTTPLTLGKFQVGTVFEFDQIVYTITVTDADIKPGQSLSIASYERCGSVSVYINSGGIASPGCGLDISNGYQIDACTLAYPVTDINSYYITVLGGASDYPEYGIPSEFGIEVIVSGDGWEFANVGLNQLITMANLTVYTLPVAGINDFTGQLEFVYSWIPAGNQSAATPVNTQLEVYFDVLPYCAQSPDLIVNLSSSVTTDYAYLNACQLLNAQVRVLYIIATQPGANFQVINSGSFIRNLDVYTDNPQSGSVVPYNTFNPPDFVDEEHYSITVDSTQYNFQFQAWFEGDNIPPGLSVTAAQDAPPSYCFTSGNYLAKASGSEVLLVDWCQIDPFYPTYLTINYPTTSAEATQTSIDYELSYATIRTKNPETLTQGTAKCDTAKPDEPNFYTFGVNGLAGNQYWELSVYAIDGNGTSSCDLDVYINLGSQLATSNCKTLSGTCSGACDGSSETPCTWENFCYTSGNVTVGVYNSNNGADVSYYIKYSVVSVPVTSLVLNQFGTFGNAADTTAQTSYYSVSVSTATTATSQYIVDVYNNQGLPVSVSYKAGRIPGTGCESDVPCGAADCGGSVSPCSTIAAGTTYYFAVTTQGSFTFFSQVYAPIPVAQLTLGTYYEDALFDGGSDIFELVIDQSILTGARSDVTVSIYGVHTGEFNAWISKSSYGAPECSVATGSIGLGSSSAMNLVISACDLTAGTYYITLTATEAATCASSIPYGIVAFFGTSSAAVTLTNGLGLTTNVEWASPSISGTSYFIAPVPNTNANNGITVQIVPSNDLVEVSATAYYGDECGSNVEVPYQTYWWCSGAPTQVLLEVTAYAPTDGSVLPGQTYTITSSGLTFTNLTAANATGQVFAHGYNTTSYFTFGFQTEESIEIEVYVTSGPAVFVQVLSDCQTVLTSLTCFTGACYIPIAYGNGDLLNGTTYYITVTGAKPTTYNLSVLVGQEQTCVVPPDTSLCTVDWTVWNYGGGDAGFQGQDYASLRLYNQLVAAFVPPCEEISSSCNDSLIEYACTQSYRACDDAGFSSSVCEDSCQDVEENCGYTFTEVGLPWLACTHNFYYDSGDEICDDIYDITDTGNGNKLLWLIVLIVVFLVLAIFIGIGAFLIYKKVKSKAAAGSYEAIDDNGAYDDHVSSDDN